MLDRAAAERALGDIDPQAVIDVVNAEMLRALRVVSVERGHDPRDFALVAFGGAGPLHACALAEELGIDACSCPRRQASSRRSASSRATSAATASCRTSARSRRRASSRPTGEADLRYRGQSFELTVPLEPDLAERLPPRPRGAVRLRRPERELELVAVRTADVTPGPDVSLQATDRYKVAGPALVELPGATCWVPAGWSGETNDDGTLVLRR